MGKLSVKRNVFISTDPDDPTAGRDSVFMNEVSNKYYFFKSSVDHILLKPFKENNNLLKLNRSELFAFLNKEQISYFTVYTSNYMLCIDSIPRVSKRLFDNFNRGLFEFSKLPSTVLYSNDSLNHTCTTSEKENLAREELVVFISTDSEDPTIGRDSIVNIEYNILDTTREHALILTGECYNYSVKVRTISCGFERGVSELAKMMIPFGYLPYDEYLPYSTKQFEMLDAIIQLQMLDRLNTEPYNMYHYEEYFDGQNE